jgi:hypothetical protein
MFPGPLQLLNMTLDHLKMVYVHTRYWTDKVQELDYSNQLWDFSCTPFDILYSMIFTHVSKGMFAPSVMNGFSIMNLV